MKFSYLGQDASYPDTYKPDLIQAVPRKRPENMPRTYYGFDLWWAYEISWLDQNQKPNIAVAQIQFPGNSEYLIESKSLKLYLNSINMMCFKKPEDVLETITQDLTQKFQAKVLVKFESHGALQVSNHSEYLCLDDLPVNGNFDQISPNYLTTTDEHASEKLVSHLLKSNCLVTNQPDWGSLFISYKGPKINHTGLLKYIISYRNHNGFHEHCVDQCYADIMQRCQPAELIVHAQYTRRGGLDINPVRSSVELKQYKLTRTFRQ